MIRAVKYFSLSFFVITVIGILSASFVLAAEGGKISGLMFGDYYWFAKNHDKTTSLSNDTGYEGQNGFWLRRIYLTYDYNFDEEFSTRFRFEANSPDFTNKTATNMTPIVKDAYLKYKWDTRNLFFGLSGAPTFELVENHWGYRPIEKSPEDLWGFGSSRDFGFAAKGSCADGLFGYHLMLGNGSGNKHEVNKGKKAYLSLTTAPTKELVFEFYGDYESNSHNSTSHVFGGYKTDSYWGGVLFSHLKKSDGKDGFNGFNVTSLYAAAKTIEKLSVFGRVDFLSAAGLGDADYLHTSKTAKPTLIIAGLDYELAKNAHMMPNIELVKYDSGVDTDVIPRLTFSWVF
jgi:hypothetical protein